MPTDPRSHKQGDHVFAGDLRKVFDELTGRVGTVLGDRVEARTLTAAFARCKAILADPVYHTTVDKGVTPSHGDAHSQAYGQFKERFVRAVVNYLFAIRQRYQPPPGPGASREALARFQRDVLHNDQFVVNAVLGIEVAVGEWVRSVVDEPAEALALGRGASLAAGYAGLRQIRSEILAAVRRH